MEEDSKMSNLRKIRDEEKESKYGYVYAVSGPGKLLFLKKLLISKFELFSGYCRTNGWVGYVRTRASWVFRTCRGNHPSGG